MMVAGNAPNKVGYPPVERSINIHVTELLSASIGTCTLNLVESKLFSFFKELTTGIYPFKLHSYTFLLVQKIMFTRSNFSFFF